MKVESLSGPAIKSRFEDDDTEDFEIAPEAYGLVMKYLTEIYDNPTQAAVRETISNAFDAHQAAGTTQKVEITVSSFDSQTPYFEVTDFGIGMSMYELKKVYTKYGISTKRDTDNAIGGFGLGCKAPLAIEDRFFVESTKNGETVIVENYTGNGGKFKQDVVDKYPSDKPNGTTVRINLEKTSLYTLRENLKSFLEYVNPDLYTLKTTDSSDDFAPVYVLSKKDKYHLITDTDEFKIYANLNAHYYDKPKIVMGEVAYNFEIPDSIQRNTKLGLDSLKVVIIAPINSVTITTSRENTQDTKKTRSFLEKAYLQYEADINNYFQKYIDEADSPKEVYKRVREANGFARAKYNYKGEEVVDKLKLEKNADYAVKRHGSSPGRGFISEIGLAGSENKFMVRADDTPDTKEGAITRALNAFLSSYEIESGTFYFLDKEEPKIESWWVLNNPDIQFIDKGDILSVAAEYRKQQRRLNGTRPRAGKVSYVVIDNDPDTVVDGDYVQQIEYPEIEKGISYLTMEDLVAYGVCRNPNTSIYEHRFKIKKLLDFFDFSGEVLILDKGKKEDTMVKRTRGEKLEFDWLALNKKFPLAEARAYKDYISNETTFIDTLKETLGGNNFNNLADPRFGELLSKDTEDDSEMMSDEEFRTYRTFVLNLNHHGSNDYTRTNYDKIAEMKQNWRSLGSYYWISGKTEGSRARIELLKEVYARYISMNVGRTNPKLVTQVFNTIYENYLTEQEKML